MQTVVSFIRLRDTRRLVCSVLTAFAMVALVSTEALASHFRYATISAVPVLNAHGQPTGKMRFTITSAWRRSFFPLVVNGATTFLPEDFNFGDGTAIQPLTLTVTSFSSSEDWVIGEATIEHQYPAGNPANSPRNTWIAFGASSARIANLNNGANAGWRYETVVRPWSTNSAPTAALPPIVTVPRSTAAQFFVPASDSDLDPLTGLRQKVFFRMSTNAGATPIVPPGLAINENTGRVTWDNHALDTVQFWFTQFIIENRDGNGVTAWAPVDVLLKIIDTPSPPPTTLINGSATPVSFSVAPGSPVSFTVLSSDPDGAVPVTLNASGLPTAATMSPLLPYTATAPTTTTFTWTPTAADAGSRTINFTTTDNVGLQKSNSVNIFVETNKPPTISGPATHTTPFTPQAPITVQVADENGDPMTVTWTVDGVPVRTDNVTENATQLTYAGFGSAGPHTVTVTVTDTKHAAAILTTAVTVTKVEQTISFGALVDRTYGDPDFGVNATASSNLPVVFAASGNCTVTNGLVHLTGAGACTITALQAGDARYAPAPDEARSFSINKGTPTVRVTGGTFTYDAQAHPATGSVSGVGGADLGAPTFTYNGVAETPIDAGSYAVVGSFAGDTNHSPATGEATIVITKATPMVRVASGTFTYNAQAHLAIGSVTGVGGSDLGAPPLTYNGVAQAPVNAGSYAVVASFAGNTNYNPATGEATIVITRATPNVSVTGGTFTYDALAHPATGSVTGVGGADLGAPAFTYNGVAGAPVNAGTYAVGGAFAGDGNYTQASHSTAAIVINKAALTVRADNTSKLLGAPLPVFTASYAGFVSGEGPASLGGSLLFTTAATAASPVGTYAITPGGLASGNYAIAFVAGTLNITYGVCLGFDPGKAHNSGSTIPIKLQLCGASGPVSGSPSIVVRATQLIRVSNQATGEVEESGQANPDDNFRLVGFGYLFNLQTKGLTTGIYRLVFTVTGDPESHSLLFQIR